MKKVILCFLLLLFFGCGSSGPTFKEMSNTIPQLSQEKIRLFFMRPDGFEYVMRDAPITLNDEDIGDLPNESFFYIDMAPKNLSMETSLWDVFGKSTLSFKPEAGGTYYIVVNPREESLEAFLKGGILGTIIESLNKKTGGAFAMDLIDEKTAKEMLTNLEFESEP